MNIGDEVVICAKLEFFAGDYETYHGYIYSINGQTTPTGIQTIKANNAVDNAFYDLQGRKIANSKLSKGIYIHNGKKVVIK